MQIYPPHSTELMPPYLEIYWPGKQFKADIQVHTIVFSHCFLFASAGTDAVWMVFAQS